VKSRDEARAGVWIASLDGRVAKRLLLDQSNVEWVSPGYVLFVREATLVAQAFDPDRHELVGQPHAIIRPMVIAPTQRYAPFSASQGVLAYRGSSRASELVWVDRRGRVSESLTAAGFWGEPALSRDASRLAVSASDPATNNFDLFILELHRGNAARRFTFTPWAEFAPLWSPDGNRLVFSSGRTGAIDLWEKRVEGTSEERPLVSVGRSAFSTDWSLDGAHVLFVSDGALWTVSVEDGTPRVIIESQFAVGDARLSPDGRYLAYSSNEGGVNHIYVQPFAEAGRRWRITVDSGGQFPRWRSDGGELFYLANDPNLTLMSLTVEGEASFQDVPVALFETHALPMAYRAPYAVAPDGEKFIVARRVEEPPPALSVVLNWQRLLEKPGP
jgi:eukaryotic-like serine/threonine-protein kinase